LRAEEDDVSYEAEDLEKLDAERGYQVRGEKEVRLREWFSLREADGGPKEFGRLVDRLRARKWAKENPSRRLQIGRSWAARNRARETARVRDWRHRKTREQVTTCANRECDVQWCPVPGGNLRGNKRRIYCSQTCFNRERYLRRKATP
jgi:hypothetical protein